MQIRLPQILIAMALVLLAGLAAVSVFERRHGGASVPGVVLLAQPQLDAAALGALAERLPGARVERVPAGPGPLAPFDGAALAHHLRQGYDTLLLAPGGPPAPEAGWSRRALVYPRLSTKDPFAHALDDALLAIRSHADTVPFLVGVLADPQPPERLRAFVDACAEALALLPRFRRSSVVLLGARDAASARATLRLDVGRWVDRAQPRLADLLEPGW